MSDRGEHVKINLGGVGVIVDPVGGKVGNNTWHYKFHAFGVTFLIHRNPNNTQQVRATYGAEALILNPLPALHAHVRQFLSSLGLTITKETLTRVDMQVMVDNDIKDFLHLILYGHDIRKARKDSIYRRSGKFETYRTGDIDNVQVCIYDKRAEMKRMEIEKWELMIRESIGLEWWASERPITRIEFRLGRTALKCLGVNSVEDMLKSERGIIDLITHDWFRLLETPKVRGRENKTNMHPLWVRVRELFFNHFPGDEVRDVTWREPKPVSCDSTSLLGQAEGCFSTAIAIQGGKPVSPADIDDFFKGWILTVKDTIFRKATQRAEEREIKKGVRLGVDRSTLDRIRQESIDSFHTPTLRLRR